MKKIIITTLLLTFALGTGSLHAKDNKGKALPHGLQKKIDRGGQLPPGWQKKLIVGEHLDRDIYRAGRVVIPVGRRGEITIEVEGRVIRLIEATREIVEILK